MFYAVIFMKKLILIKNIEAGITKDSLMVFLALLFSLDFFRFV